MILRNWKRDLAMQGLQRLFLHAARLSFQHPLGAKRLALEAELPAELKAFLKAGS